MQNNSKSVDLLNGPILKGILKFTIPLFWGQLLQSLYSITDAWVLGNYAEKEAFAAVSAGGALSFFIVGFLGGVGAGGGIVISKHFGEGNEEATRKSVHANIVLAILASIVGTAVGLLSISKMLVMMDTPADVLPYSLLYFRIYFIGLFSIVFYNAGMNIMRSLGDSFHPLIYLVISSVTNVILDILFVAVWKKGVVGAAVATIIAQFLAVVLCFIRMARATDLTRLQLSYIKWYPDIMKEVLMQGLPMGLQNSVISIGNICVQSHINSFGSDAMSGMGAYSKFEGFVFLPINCMSMALPTFVSQNLGAGKIDRIKKGSFIGITLGVVFAEVVGAVMILFAPQFLGIFVDNPEAIRYGTIHIKTAGLFFCLLAFSHCAAGVLRGCGKSIIPMFTMLSFWCGLRVLYLTIACKHWHHFSVISSCYPLTWACSSIVFAICFIKYFKKDAFFK